MRLTLDPDFTPVTIAGRPWYQHVSGRLLPRISGGDGPEGEGESETDPGPGDGEKPKTLTQAQVDKIVGREKAAAKKAAENELKTWLEAQKGEADLATLDEAARAKAEAEQAKAQADADRAAAASERLAAKVERKLIKAGVDDKQLARIMRTVDLANDADDDAIDAEVEALVETFPAAFAAPDGDGTGKAPSGKTAVKPPAGGQPTKGSLAKGAERYQSKHAKPTAA